MYSVAQRMHKRAFPCKSMLLCVCLFDIAGGKIERRWWPRTIYKVRDGTATWGGMCWVICCSLGGIAGRVFRHWVAKAVVATLSGIVAQGSEGL